VRFYATGAGEGAIPVWAWASWTVVIGSGIVLSMLWVGNLWLAYFKERKESSRKKEQ
jgi:hypothetical protein